MLHDLIDIIQTTCTPLLPPPSSLPHRDIDMNVCPRLFALRTSYSTVDWTYNIKTTYHTATTLSPYRHHTVTIPPPHCHHTATTLSPYRHHTVTIPPPHCHHTATTLSPYRHHTVTIPPPHATTCHHTATTLQLHRNLTVKFA